MHRIGFWVWRFLARPLWNLQSASPKYLQNILKTNASYRILCLRFLARPPVQSSIFKARVCFLIFWKHSGYKLHCFILHLSIILHCFLVVLRLPTDIHHPSALTPSFSPRIFYDSTQLDFFLGLKMFRETPGQSSMSDLQTENVFDILKKCILEYSGFKDFPQGLVQSSIFSLQPQNLFKILGNQMYRVVFSVWRFPARPRGNFQSSIFKPRIFWKYVENKCIL